MNIPDNMTFKQDDLNEEFEQDSLKEEFEKLDEKLKDIVFLVCFLAHFLFDETLVVTSIYRPGGGVHSFYRGLDFRIFKNSGEAGTYRVAEIVNSIYKYDPTRSWKEVAITNLYHGNAPHLHLQTHPRTDFFDDAHKGKVEKILVAQRKAFVPKNIA